LITAPEREVDLVIGTWRLAPRTPSVRGAIWWLWPSMSSTPDLASIWFSPAPRDVDSEESLQRIEVVSVTLAAFRSTDVTGVAWPYLGMLRMA